VTWISSKTGAPEIMYCRGKKGNGMFEQHYNDEMEAEVKRLEAKARAVAAGNPHWKNACAICGCELVAVDITRCERCLLTQN
jgi:hypothetical protein